MEFEFDSQKNVANQIKHGIDFEEAQFLWDDARLLVVPARTEGEIRYLAIGKIGGRHWSAIFTRRGDRVRLISVRRARSSEVKHYESD